MSSTSQPAPIEVITVIGAPIDINESQLTPLTLPRFEQRAVIWTLASHQAFTACEATACFLRTTIGRLVVVNVRAYASGNYTDPVVRALLVVGFTQIGMVDLYLIRPSNHPLDPFSEECRGVIESTFGIQLPSGDDISRAVEDYTFGSLERLDVCMV